jgi:hypothetical protein
MPCKTIFQQWRHGPIHSWDPDSERYITEHATLSLAHPEILPLCWDGSVLTKLTGTLDSQRVTGDLPVRWTSFKPYRQHFYTSTGALCIAWLVFFYCACGLILIMLLTRRRRVREPGGVRFFQGITMPRVLLAALLAGGITYFVLPKLRDADVQVREGRRSQNQAWRLHNAIGEMHINDPALAHQDARAAEENILKLSASAVNELQGGPVRIESSPGNFTVEQHNGKIIVYVYASDGYPWMVKP